ncbi:MAG TPA: hypothetical protein VHQ65_09515 [Thermoanaerobaculia bacterium]|nr:hypothetical protein [Thermoanaerobaculia bacterium]
MSPATERRCADGIAAGWGLAEATVFFFVPDVWLSWLALRAPRHAFRACLWATAGAVAGGAAMISFGGAEPATAEALLDAVPGIGPGLVTEVRRELANHGFLALFLGPLRGVPYKIYAAEAGVLGLSPVALLAWTVPARLLRFLAVTAFAAVVAALPPLRRRPRLARVLHLLAWSAFYAFYFWTMGV